MQQAGNNNSIQYSITSQRSNNPCQHTYTHKHIQFMVHSNANYTVAKETMTGAAGRPPYHSRPPCHWTSCTVLYTHNYIILCTRKELCGDFVVVAIPVNVLIHGNKASYWQAFQWNDGSIKSQALHGGGKLHLLADKSHEMITAILGCMYMYVCVAALYGWSD